MRTIGVYNLEYDMEDMCCLRKIQSTGYAEGYNISSGPMSRFSTS